MCGSMADIQSATAEIRRGKKEGRRTNDRVKIWRSALFHRATIKRRTNSRTDLKAFVVVGRNFSQFSRSSNAVRTLLKNVHEWPSPPWTNFWKFTLSNIFGDLKKPQLNPLLIVLAVMLITLFCRLVLVLVTWVVCVRCKTRSWEITAKQNTENGRGKINICCFFCASKIIALHWSF